MGVDPWDPEVISWRPRYLKPHLILTLWLGCRVKARSSRVDCGRVFFCACACLCVYVWCTDTF